MLTKKIQLWEHNNHISLTAYILDNPNEFKADKKRPAVIICPGGGYLGIVDRESEPVAMRFAANGYHVFVLRYSTYYTEKISDYNNLPNGNEKSAFPAPWFDLAKAMVIIKENADKWCLDSDKITLCGFSAGGHLAAYMGVHWQDDILKKKFKVHSKFFKPNALILGYPLLDFKVMKDNLLENPNEFQKRYFEISSKAVFGNFNPSDKELTELSPVNYVSSNTPPSFIWHTADDSFVYVENSIKFASQLTRNKVPYELHIFEQGPHGLSLCDETTAGDESHISPHCSIWFDLAMEWMKKYI
ncbi:alpha/beta hydrolase [Clostridium sp. JN-9]|uniref:alpha/beta hydrolase n=1 Tax=Clostridium sp. JN-9 TaxID=2507159 RepID=UPI000FFE1F2B|nr:alpha/beta hydrolase [Clostridium sp. JN-9]QAT39752.1 alpha/beta hydrolase [Clostridium sp. JN-9]